MRDGRLQGIQTIVERQQCMPGGMRRRLPLPRPTELWTAAFSGRSEDRSPTNDFRHLRTVFWLIRSDWPEPSGSLDYAVSLDGPPLYV